MIATTRNHRRIALRTSLGIKELIARAAATAGMSTTAFLLETGQERARQILAEQGMMMLTSHDWNAFANTLDNIDRSRPKLSAAMKRHHAWRQAQASVTPES